MKKQFDKFFVANLRRTAQMVSPLVRRKQKLQADATAIAAEILSLNDQIESLDGHIRRATGGFGVEELIKRSVVDTGKVDKQGNPIKITKWDLVYPETIVPPVSEVEKHDEVSDSVDNCYDPVLGNSPASNEIIL